MKRLLTKGQRLRHPNAKLTDDVWLYYNPFEDITAAEIAQMIAIVGKADEDIPEHLLRHFEFDKAHSDKEKPNDINALETLKRTAQTSSPSDRGMSIPQHDKKRIY